MKLAMSFSLLPLGLSPPYLSIASPFTLQLPVLSSILLYPSYIGADEDTSSEGSSQEEYDGSATGGFLSRTSRSLREHHSDRRPPKSDHFSERGRVQVSEKHIGSMARLPSQKFLVEDISCFCPIQSMPTRLGVTSSQSDFPPTQPMKKKTQAMKPSAPDNGYGLQTAHGKQYVLNRMGGKATDRPMTDPARKRAVGDKRSGKRSPLESTSAATYSASKSTPSPESPALGMPEVGRHSPCIMH